MRPICRNLMLAAILSTASCTPPPGPAHSAPHDTAPPPAVTAQAGRTSPTPDPVPQAEAVPTDESPDEMLLLRNGFAKNLSPRRCNRATTELSCVAIDVPARGTLHLTLSAELADARGYGCRPTGDVKTTTDGRRVHLSVAAPLPSGAGTCRAHTELGGHTTVGPLDRGRYELVADNGEIAGVTFEGE